MHTSKPYSLLIELVLLVKNRTGMDFYFHCFFHNFIVIFETGCVCVYLHVSSVDSHCGLRDILASHKFEIEWPHPPVLCQWECPEGTIECMTCSCNLTLVHQK